ncbi:glycosyltransferase family 4 protein [Chitinophagaceae bacterium MMS25-I14]
MNAPPHIAILCASVGFGGLELNTLKLAGWLRAYGWQVSLMVAEGTVMHQRAVAMGEKVYTMPAKSRGLGLNKMQPLRRWLKETQAEILFTPLNKDIATGSMYKRLYNSRLKLVYQQQMQVGVNKKDLIHTLRYSMVDMWVAPLQYLREEVIEKTRVDAGRIAVIPLGIEAGRFLNNTISKAEARTELSLPQDAKVIGVLGRIDPKKGQDFLVKAMDYLRKFPELDYHLMIMGAITHNEGDFYLKSVYKLVDDYNLHDRVHFRESRSKVELFYSAIDIFAMPSHGETFGMVTIEAMASGRPVIGTNRCGTKEILQEGKLGYLYEYEDLEDFRLKLEALQHNMHLGEMVDAARTEVLQKYTSQIMCRMLDEAFRKLLKK